MTLMDLLREIYITEIWCTDLWQDKLNRLHLIQEWYSSIVHENETIILHKNTPLHKSFHLRLLTMLPLSTM